MADKIYVSCSKSENNHTHQNAHNITQIDDVSSSSKGNLVDFMPLNCFKTNATQPGIHENEVILRCLEYQCNLLLNTITQQYLSNLVSMIETHHSHNIKSENIIYAPRDTKNITDITSSVINMNKDSTHFNRRCPEENYDAIKTIDLQGEPPRKMFKNISTFVESNSKLASTSSQMMGNIDKDIMDTRNQLEIDHTFSSSHIAMENAIRRDITDTNTLQQRYSKTYFNTSLLKHANVDSNPQILMKNHQIINNDESSLQKISSDSYKFNFYLNNTPFSYNFCINKKLHFVSDLSGIPIKVNKFNFTKPLFNKSGNNFYWRRYSYFVAIFHAVELVRSNTLGRFKISVSSREYQIIQKLDVYIYQSIQTSEQELRLKCPHIRDFNILINKLLETTFPIYSFPKASRSKKIRFLLLDYNLINEEITFNEYIKNVTEYLVSNEIQHASKYNSAAISNAGKKKFG